MYQHDLYKYLDFRVLEENDLSAVLQIERACYDFPWSEKIFLDCVRSDYVCEAVTLYNELIGYVIVSQVLDEAHLLNICLAKQWQGQGLGYSVMQHLLERLKQEKIKRVFLEVRPSNSSALALYQRLGFETIGVRKNYYPAHQSREDALAMMLIFIQERW